jgi:hypothetical protein
MKAEGRRKKEDQDTPLLPCSGSRLPGAVDQGCARSARGGGSYDSRVTRSRVALLAALLACAACGPQPRIFEGDYLTYEHAFTDAAVAGVRKNAEATCRQRSQIAVSTSRACSLTQCTTSYQCVTDEPIVLPATKNR